MRQDFEEQGEGDGTVALTSEAHFKQIFLDQDFVKAVLTDLQTFRTEEEKTSQASEPGETQLLYSSFLQDTVEFLMTAIIPVKRDAVLKSYQDILNIKEGFLGDLTDWLDPLLKTSLFLHYFNDELSSLPLDLLKEVHDQTRLEKHQGLDHVLLLDKVPFDESLYPKAWLREQIVEMCVKHRARILNPARDIHFEEDEYEEKKPKDAESKEETTKMVKCYTVTVILDGWDHMTALPDYEEYFRSQNKLFEGFDQIQSSDYREFIDLVPSDTEEEEEEGEDLEKAAQKKKEEEEKKKAEEELTPTEWPCGVCTYANRMTVDPCELCATGRRPSREELVAELKRAR